MKLVAVAIALTLAAWAQTNTGKGPKLAKDPGAFPGVGDTDASPRAVRPAPPPAGPAPHFSDGRPDFGGKGAWFPGFAGNIAETQWKGVHSADKHVDVPFLPTALELFNHRVETIGKEDPEAQCLPVGVPRYMFDPYAFQMIQTRDRVLFLFEGDNYLWREVFTDGRKHPASLKPSWLGDSVGRYEGDTLVIDVIGFNGKAWLDQAGHPQSPKQHLVERYTRVDERTLKYEVTIDDPGAYSKPWTTSNTVRWRPGFELLENICQENEKDSRHMLSVPDPWRR